MAMFAEFEIAAMFGTLVTYLYVALGLGLVIFFHELGHFAVAKWCDVFVERFSIGFGPVLWSFKRGETEYALSLIPFGGYVKMLGQDDIDPSQLSSEEIAQDPRSYSAKSVPQRMAIISAGVAMNIITGLLFFALAFQMGVEAAPSVIGSVEIGSPAWVAGLSTGDEIDQLNGEPIAEWSEVMLGVALSSGKVDLKGTHSDGEEFEKTIAPDESGTRRVLGVREPLGLRLIIPRDSDATATNPGMAAHNADPPFEPGDLIRRVDDVEVETFAQLQETLARRRDQTLTFYVQRKDEEESENLEAIRVGTNHFRTLGLTMDIGPISQIVQGSPAHEAGFKIGDKLTKVNGRVVGRDINPLRLPDEFAALAGEDVTVDVVRQEETGGPQEHQLTVKPRDIPGWLERPTGVDVPMSAAAIGIAYSVIPHVLEVEEGSPAANQGIQVGQSVKKVELIADPDAESDGSEKPIEIEFTEDTHNWAYAFWMIQSYPTRSLRVTVGVKPSEQVLEFAASDLVQSEDWFLPTRGIRLQVLTVERKASSVAEAAQMGLSHTEKNIVQIYLTLKSLVRGDVSPKELHGPVGIATVAYQVAEQGIAKLLLFLGFLSVNLAVLNFLPIPVLDGGHMVFLAWEAVTRKRPSERVLVAATYAGMMFVLSLMVFVLYLDIFVHLLGD